MSTFQRNHTRRLYELCLVAMKEVQEELKEVNYNNGRLYEQA